MLVVGRKNVAACRRAPRTCELLEKFTEATSCKRGQVLTSHSVSLDGRGGGFLTTDI